MDSLPQIKVLEIGVGMAVSQYKDILAKGETTMSIKKTDRLIFY